MIRRESRDKKTFGIPVTKVTLHTEHTMVTDEWVGCAIMRNGHYPNKNPRLFPLFVNPELGTMQVSVVDTFTGGSPESIL